MTRKLRSRAGTLPALLATAAASLALAACGSSASSSAGSANSRTAGSAKPASSHGAIVALRASSAGQVLVDGTGRSLYLWRADKGTHSTCSGSCAANWPPLSTESPPLAGRGVSAAKLATSKRSDGSLQVTYNGHPLYYFIGDASPGQTNGEGSDAYGAPWYLVSAAGNAVTEAANGKAADSGAAASAHTTTSTAW